MQGYKTYLLGLAVLILPILEKLQLLDLSGYIPEGYREIALSGLGLAIIVLRKVTAIQTAQKG